METKTWAKTAALSTVRLFDECAKAFILEHDIESAYACRKVAKAAENALSTLKGDNK